MLRGPLCSVGCNYTPSSSTLCPKQTAHKTRGNVVPPREEEAVTTDSCAAADQTPCPPTKLLQAGKLKRIASPVSCRSPGRRTPTEITRRSQRDRMRDGRRASCLPPPLHVACAHQSPPHAPRPTPAPTAPALGDSATLIPGCQDYGTEALPYATRQHSKLKAAPRRRARARAVKERAHSLAP